MGRKRRRGIAVGLLALAMVALHGSGNVALAATAGLVLLNLVQAPSAAIRLRELLGLEPAPRKRGLRPRPAKQGER
jgi:hypothetical protein